MDTDGAVYESVVFLDHFRDMPEHRQAAKVLYPLPEILLLCLLAVLAGSEAFTDIARFGEKKLALLRRFWPFKDGTPTHDHLGDIMATLDAEKFQQCVVSWVASQTGAAADVIAIDGKTLRRSGSKKNGTLPIHRVSAFAARQRLVMGQVKTGEKANEITAIPKLLDLMAIEGAIVSIDAMGCQRESAAKIIEKKADYVLALKGNQGTLRDDVALFVAEPHAHGFTDTATSRHQTSDGDHGRIETRTTTVIEDSAGLKKRHDWPGRASVVMVETIRAIGTETETETRFYITSLARAAQELGPIIRRHWAIENSLHWVMDMVFRDDECRVRTENAPANFTTVKHIALNRMRRADSKDSLRLRKKVAAWDDEFLVSLIKR